MTNQSPPSESDITRGQSESCLYLARRDAGGDDSITKVYH